MIILFIEGYVKMYKFIPLWTDFTAPYSTSLKLYSSPKPPLFM